MIVLPSGLFIIVQGGISIGGFGLNTGGLAGLKLFPCANAPPDTFAKNKIAKKPFLIFLFITFSFNFQGFECH